MRVWYGFDTVHMIDESAESARKAAVEYGYELEDSEIDDWERVASGQQIEISYPDRILPDPLPEGATVEDGFLVSAKASAWVEAIGEGPLCSEDWD